MSEAGDARRSPDGYQYGVMFSDGSVRAIWNGRTQRERATAERDRLDVEWSSDRHVLVRRIPPDGKWLPC